MKTNKETDILDFMLDFFETILNGVFSILDWVFQKKNHVLETDFEGKGGKIAKKYKTEGITVDGVHALPRKTCYENVALFGATGTGKGVNSVIPTALEIDDASVIIHDPSGSVLEATIGNFEKKGYEVIILDFAKSNESSGYNPLAHLTKNTEIATISHLLIAASMGESKSDPFWSQASISLLNMLISLTMEMPPHLRHLPNVLHMLETYSHSTDKFDRFVAKFCKSDKVFSQYKSFITQSEKLNSSIVANTKAALQLFEAEDLAKTVSYNQIDFKQLRKQKTVIYLRNNIAHQKMYGPITSIFITQLFEFILSKIPDETNEMPIFLLLDEMSSIYLKDFSTYLSNSRKHLCSVFHAWQSSSQVYEIYKNQADAILANSRSQVYFPAGMDYASAENLSKRLGEYEWEDEKGRRSKRRLMHPQELIQSEPNSGILLVGHHRPIQLKMTPYYQQRKLLQKSEIQAKVVNQKTEDKGIPLFDFS